MLDDMIADMISYKKRHPILTDIFLRDRKLNISLVLISQSRKLQKDDNKLS